MALTISQIVASSYNAVVAERKKPANQWEESAMIREMKRQGMVESIPGGPQIEAPLDYRRNPGAEFNLLDLDPLVMGKTDVVTAAIYDPAQVSIPVVWSKADESKNPTENQKINFVSNLLTNALASHDDLFEQNIFAVSNAAFLGLQTQIPDSGQGTVGGINAAVELWWRHFTGTYAAAGTDLIAKMAIAFNTAQKGTGGQGPSLIVSDAETQGTFEGTQQPLQRWVDSQDLKAGFKTLAYKSARYIYSQFGNNRIYFLSNKGVGLKYFEGAMRQKGDTQEINNAQGYRFFIHSMAQLIVTMKSRNAILTEV